MKVLVVGGGGREHALCWKIAQSSGVEKIYCAPGNAGIAKVAECIDIPADNIEGLADFAGAHGVGLTVVGPEPPLIAGIVNLFQKRKLRIFGPPKEAAILEGSKVFSKTLMRKCGIPTAEFRVFESPRDAKAYLKEAGYPLVVKADGLAAGKGAVVCQSPEAAHSTVENMMEKKEFGQAGEKIVVEDFLTGQEASIIALTDGKSIMVFESSQDHKSVYDGDEGPNTGGMGAYSPAPLVTDAIESRIEGEILVPIVHAMKKEKRHFRGVIYAGLMITRSGPKVLEFNVRFGDPETQPLIARLDVDIVELLSATIDGELDRKEIRWKDRAAVCVVLASGGYPGSYTKEHEISGLDAAEKLDDVIVFHAGTSTRDDKVVTAGGRVLGVTALGDTVAQAQKRAYQAVRKIRFKGMHFRKDIAAKAIQS